MKPIPFVIRTEESLAFVDCPSLALVTLEELEQKHSSLAVASLAQLCLDY